MIRLADVDLHVVEHGENSPTLLLIHGWGSDHTVWRGVVELAAVDHRAILADLRGHGRSSIARTRHTIPAMADDFSAVLGLLELSNVVAIGHSMGANVAVQLALQEPQRVVGVVNVDPAYGDPAVANAAERATAIERGGSSIAAVGIEAAFPPDAEPELVQQAAAILSGTEPRVLVESLYSTYLDTDAFGNIDATRRVLRGLRQPLLSIYARPDVAAVASGYPVERHHIETIPGSCHYIPLSHPGELWGVIRQWIARH
jgi:pimeloyl-ACP methyl ester carboxylesterase